MEDKIYQAHAHVAFRRIGDQCVLVPVRTAPEQELCLFSLNTVGAHLWERLDRPRSAADLAASVVATFDIDLATATRDVTLYLSALAARGLVSEVTP